MPIAGKEMNICSTVGDLIRELSTLDLKMTLDCGNGYLPVVVADPTAPGDAETLRLDDEFERM